MKLSMKSFQIKLTHSSFYYSQLPKKQFKRAIIVVIEILAKIIKWGITLSSSLKPWSLVGKDWRHRHCYVSSIYQNALPSLIFCCGCLFVFSICEALLTACFPPHNCQSPCCTIDFVYWLNSRLFSPLFKICLVSHKNFHYIITWKSFRENF